MLSAVLFLSLLAQDARSRPVFSSHADLVVLHVSVVDRHAGFVSDLPREAFSVADDGRPQRIDFFEHEDTPVTVGLLIDNSGSMMPRRDAVIAAGMAFAASSNPSDELFTLNFNEHVWPGLPRGQEFTSDRDELRGALNASGARGETALFDAVAAGLQHLRRGQKPRKVLIVVSDGGDNASRTSFEDVLATALRTDVVIYAIGIYDPYDRDANPRLLRRLAEVTGGEAFFPRENADVTPALERIARDIRSSYTIGYVPLAVTHAEHKVRVDVRPPDNRKLTVRTRSAYVGPAVEAKHGGR
jgi:Ca-activated chloride channel family protein